MDHIRQVEASADYIYYYGNSYEPYNFKLNFFVLATITAQFIWNFGGPEYLMLKSGQFKDVTLL